MGRKTSSHPTELELAILRVFWRDGPSTVRHICDALASERPMAFTSAITVMKIMVRKGYLESKRRSRADGGTLYSARVAESRTARNMLESLAKRLFGGTLAGALQQLVRAGEIDRSELDELRKLVNQESKGPKP